MKQIEVYLSARISEDAHDWNNFVCDYLTEPFNVFLPQDYNPWKANHIDFPKQAFDVDLEAMRKSHIGLLLPNYGRDCAWEVGWYANSDRPLVVFVNDQLDWLRDWMIKGGLDYVITTNPQSYETLKSDPILKYKPVKLIDCTSKLKDEMLQIFRKHYQSYDLSPNNLASF